MTGSKVSPRTALEVLQADPVYLNASESMREYMVQNLAAFARGAALGLSKPHKAPVETYDPMKHGPRNYDGLTPSSLAPREKTWVDF